jgi:hypothetical protein
MFNSMTGMTTHTVPPLASTCTKKNKKHKLTCTLEIHYCKLWWWSIWNMKWNWKTHTHMRSLEAQILPTTCSLSFPFQQHFQTKSSKPLFYIQKSYDSSSLLFRVSPSLPPPTFHFLFLSLTIPFLYQEKTHERKSSQDVSKSILSQFHFQFIHPIFCCTNF